MELGWKAIPCVRLDHLSDEERRAYTLIDNQITLNTSWEEKLLEDVLAGIQSIDMSVFDFDVPEFPKDEQHEESVDTGYYGDERERTADTYNLFEFDAAECVGYYQIPVLKSCNCIPDDIISFNCMLSAKKKDVGIHFYIDDYQFERIATRAAKRN